MQRSLEELGMVRVGVAAPEMRVADVAFNCSHIEQAWRQARDAGVQLLVLPELCITGYSCGDLFYQSALQRAAIDALLRLADTLTDGPAFAVGLPLCVDGRIYNCAALVADGAVAGIVPKTFLPRRSEYYESRWFVSGEACETGVVTLGARDDVPFGTDLLFEAIRPEAGDEATVEGRELWSLGLEICEDLWAPVPPSTAQAVAGATVIGNLSAGDELLGKFGYRCDLVRQLSARCNAAYLYAGAGPGESTTDMVFSGHCMVVENGIELTATPRFSFGTELAIADVDVEQLRLDRGRNSSFADSGTETAFRVVPFVPGPSPTVDSRARPETERALRRTVAPRPFVPPDSATRHVCCEEIFSIQATALAKRLRHTGLRKVTIGASGGLDSTLALLVTARAFDKLELPRDGIHAVTMPGFGTTERTRSNAEQLVEAIGAKLQIVPIADAVRQHFDDIGHDEDVHDVVYENAQARERTQILMDLANKIDGLVVGTGDLSELALGWCTYNADHMSMYHVNAGVPKTLVRYIVDHVANTETEQVRELLHDICATPVSPELLPLDVEGQLAQRTEETLGSYDLHDFFLFHTVRHAFPPAKVLFLALNAWARDHEPQAIHAALETFYRRFFAQQFKRSAMPDGPKVGTVALSPRADWRMPSDAAPDLWLEQLSACRDDVAGD